MSTRLPIADLTAAGQIAVALHDPRLNDVPKDVLRSPRRAFASLTGYGQVSTSRMVVRGAPMLFTVTVNMSLDPEPVCADGLSLQAAALRAMIECEGRVRAVVAGL